MSRILKLTARRIANELPKGGDEATASAHRLYDVGNVTLFLAGDLGSDIDGSLVRPDGSYRSVAQQQ